MCPILNTLSVFASLVMQHIGRLQTHGAESRKADTDSDHDSDHSKRHPHTAEQAPKHRNLHPLCSVTSKYIKFAKMNTAGTNATPNKTNPSAKRWRKILRREAPIAILRPISALRCCVRNQKVPMIPKKTLSRKKRIPEKYIRTLSTHDLSISSR